MTRANLEASSSTSDITHVHDHRVGRNHANDRVVRDFDGGDGVEDSLVPVPPAGRDNHHVGHQHGVSARKQQQTGLGVVDAVRSLDFGSESVSFVAEGGGRIVASDAGNSSSLSIAPTTADRSFADAQEQLAIDYDNARIMRAMLRQWRSAFRSRSLPAARQLDSVETASDLDVGAASGPDTEEVPSSAILAQSHINGHEIASPAAPVLVPLGAEPTVTVLNVYPPSVPAASAISSAIAASAPVVPAGVVNPWAAASSASGDAGEQDGESANPGSLFQPSTGSLDAHRLLKAAQVLAAQRASSAATAGGNGRPQRPGGATRRGSKDTSANITTSSASNAMQPPSELSADQQRAARRDQTRLEVEQRKQAAAIARAQQKAAAELNDAAEELRIETAAIVEVDAEARRAAAENEAMARLEARARLHYQAVIMRKHGLEPWRELIRVRCLQERKAQNYFDYSAMRKAFAAWTAQHHENVRQREMEEADQSIIALEHYRRSLLRRCLQRYRSWRLGMRARTEALRQRVKRNRMVSVLDTWQLATFSHAVERERAFAARNVEVEARFRRAVLRPVLSAWKRAVPLLKEEHEAEKRQAAMMELARQLLTGFEFD